MRPSSRPARRRTTVNLRRQAREHYDAKRYREAIAGFSQIIDDREDETEPLDYFRRAVSHDAVGELEPALGYYTKYISLKPSDCVAFTNRGAVNRKLHNFDSALVDYNEAIRLNPKLAYAYYNRGYLYHLHLEDYESALTDFSKAIQLKPDLLSASFNRGYLYILLQQYESAIVDFTNANRISGGTRSKDFLFRSFCHCHLGDVQKATEDIVRSHQFDSTFSGSTLRQGLKEIPHLGLDFRCFLPQLEQNEATRALSQILDSSAQECQNSTVVSSEVFACFEDLYDLTIILTDDGDRRLRCFRSLVLVHSEMEDDELGEEVRASKCQGISERDLLRVLFGDGSHVTSEMARELLVLFRVLRMPLPQCALLRIVAENASSDPTELLRLLHVTLKTSEDELLNTLHQDVALTDDEGETAFVSSSSDEDLRPELKTPMGSLIMNVARKAFPHCPLLSSSRAFLDRMGILEFFHSYEPRLMDSLPLFASLGIREDDLTIHGVFEAALRVLSSKRIHSNVMLTTREGVEPVCVHKEILVSQSPFFRHMMKFKGMEWKMAFGGGEIPIDLLQEDLHALVQFMYERKCIQSAVKIPILLRLVEHAEMYLDKLLRDSLIVRLAVLFNEFASPEDLNLEILLHGYLIQRLPEGVQGAIFRSIALRFDDELLRSIVAYSFENHEQLEQFPPDELRRLVRQIAGVETGKVEQEEEGEQAGSS